MKKGAIFIPILFQIPGYHVVNWHADNHPSGMYIVKMQTGPSLLLSAGQTRSGTSFIEPQKLLLVK